jgi:hypothetical protein
MTLVSQREKVVRWTRSMFFGMQEADEQMPLYWDFAGVILAHTHHLTKLEVNGVFPNSMLAIVSTSAGGSLRVLTLSFGSDSIAIFAQIGCLSMLRSLTLEADGERPIDWAALPLDTAEAWKLPLLKDLRLWLRSADTSPMLFDFFSRCDLRGLRELRVDMHRASPETTQALSTVLRDIPDLVVLGLSSCQETLDRLVPDLSCRSLHIMFTPSAHTAASLPARIRTIVVDGWCLAGDDVRDFLRSLSTNRSAQSELTRIQLKLPCLDGASGPRFLWRSDDPILTTLLGKILPHALRLRDQGVIVTDFEDRTFDQG